MQLAQSTAQLDKLIHTVTKELHDRTNAPVDGLKLEIKGQRLVIHGCVASWHAKQVASTIAQRVLKDVQPALRIDNQLAVRSSR